MAKIVLEDLNLSAAERQLVEEAIAFSSTLVEAAHRLGIKIEALKRLIKKHAIQAPERLVGSKKAKARAKKQAKKAKARRNGGA